MYRTRQRLRHNRKIAPPETAGSPKAPWLSGIEDLLDSLLLLALKTVATLGYGALALVSAKPRERLRKLQQAGKMLGWMTLVIITSAITGFFLAVVWREDRANDADDAPPWVQFSMSAIEIVRGQSYWNYFIPTLLVGLFACGMATILAWRRRDKALAEAARQYASLVFAISLIVGMGGMLAMRIVEDYLVPDSDPGRYFYLWCLLFGVAGSRAALRLARTLDYGRIPAFLRGACRRMTAIVLTFIGFLVPFAVIVSTLYAIEMLNDVISNSIHPSPEYTAKFRAYEGGCAHGTDGGNHVDCLFIVQASGESRFSVKFQEPPSLIFDLDHVIRDTPFRLRDANLLRPGQTKEIPVPLGLELRFPDKAVTAAGTTMVTIESGTPLAIVLRMKFPEVCTNRLLLDTAKNLQPIYLRMQKTSENKYNPFAFAVIGPWVSLREELLLRCRA